MSTLLYRHLLSPDWVGSLSLRREKGKPERLERKRKDYWLKLIRGRFANVVENSGEIFWFVLPS